MIDFKAQKILLAGVSAMALGAGLAAPHRAVADTTISGSTGGQNWSSGNFTVTNSGVITSSYSYALDSTAAGGSLSNSGQIISQYDTAIFNTSGGTIGSLSNSGIISGGADFTGYYYGIFNDGAIGQLSNNGTISGGTAGIYNNGTTGTLSNSGVITGRTGIENDGTIGSLSNSGIISGTNYGIFNSNTIGSLSNLAGGVISANYTAVYNIGSIGTLSNNGRINAGDVGIANFVTIGALNNEAAGVISGGDNGIDNYGTISQLTNSGAIVGNSGIENGGTIGSLSNSGVIAGADYDGIYNYGSIGALSNEAGGTIAGGTDGVYNDGTIDTLTNNGVIHSLGSAGIFNDGTIDALTNSGTISGGDTGIENYGAIGSLSNSGVIAGTNYDGIYNDGTVSVLTNSGTITGNEYGIYNRGGSSSGYGGGTITALTNNGVIHGNAAGIYNVAGSTSAAPGGTIGTLMNSGTISGGDTGIYNEGTIGSLVNSGTITGGSNAIYSTGGGLGVVSNAGLISGNINVLDQNLTITGGSNSVFGTLSGGTISLTPGDALEFASGNQILADDINVGATGTVTNDGTLQLGTPQTTPVLSFTGNLVLNADGTLVVPIAPSQSSVLNVSGSASVAGKVVYDFAPGTYTSRTYEYITASSVTGNFSSASTENLPANAATETAYLADPGVELTLTAAAVTPVTPVAPIVVAPADDTIFSAQTEAVAENTQQDMGLLLDKAAANGSSGNDAACAAAAETSANPTQNGAGTTAQLAGTLGNAFCGAGGWIEATGSLMNASRSNGAPGYNADGGGFLAGIDRVIGEAETKLGFALGYEQTRLTDGDGGTGSMGVVRVALYGAQPVGPVTLSGVISYGNASNNTTRATGFSDPSEHYSANIYSGGAQASTNVQLGPLALVPAAGIRVAGIGGSSFVESASGAAAAFAVSGTTANYNSVQPFATVSLSHQFVTGSNVAISTDAKIGYEYQAGSENVVTLLTAADGTQFHASGNKLDPSDALVSLGVAAGKNNWSVYADYGARVSGNWTAQTAEVGLRVRF